MESVKTIFRQIIVPSCDLARVFSLKFLYIMAAVLLFFYMYVG